MSTDSQIQFGGYKYHPTKMPETFVDKHQEIHHGTSNDGYVGVDKHSGITDVSNDTLKSRMVSKNCQECAEAFKALNESADKQLEYGDSIKSRYNMNPNIIKYKTKELRQINEELCNE